MDYSVIGLIVIVTIVVHFLLAIKFSEIAEMKGYSGGYFGWCFFLGLAGWLMVVALPDRNQEAIQATMQPPASSKRRRLRIKPRNAAQQNEDDRLPDL